MKTTMTSTEPGSATNTYEDTTVTAVEANPVKLFYTDSGEVPDGNSRTLVLLHGWTCDSLDWAFQIDALSARHRVIAVDLRGHGRSPAPERGYSMSELASDVAALMTDLSLDPAVIVGHSMGGIVAAVLAVEYPHLVRATVVVEPAYGHDEATVEFFKGATGQFGTPAGNAVAAELLGATEPTAEPWRKTWHKHRTLGMPPHAMKQAFDGMYIDTDSIGVVTAADAYLARRTSPTLALHCLPARADWEQKLLTNSYSRSASFEGSGHWVQQERPEEFNEMVLAWIDGLPEE